MLNSCILTQFLVVFSVLSGVMAQADNSTTDCDLTRVDNCDNLRLALVNLLGGNDEAATLSKCEKFKDCSDVLSRCLKLDVTEIRSECAQKLAATPVGTPPTDVTPGPLPTTVSSGTTGPISDPTGSTPDSTAAPTVSSTTSDPVPTPPSTSAPTGSPSPSDPPTPPSTTIPSGLSTASVPTAQPTVPTVPTAQPTIPTVPTAQPTVPTVPTTTPTPPKPVSSACLKALSAINKAQYVQMIFDSVEDPRPSNSMRCSGIQMADNSAQDDVRAYCGPEDLTKLNEYVAAARARFGCAPPVVW